MRRSVPEPDMVYVYVFFTALAGVMSFVQVRLSTHGNFWLAVVVALAVMGVLIALIRPLTKKRSPL